MPLNIDLNGAFMLVGAFIVAQVLILAVKYFWDKFTKAEEKADKKYVKRSFCETCEKAGKAADGQLAKKLIVVERLLFLMAIKMDIEPEEIQKLISTTEGL